MTTETAAFIPADADGRAADSGDSTDPSTAAADSAGLDNSPDSNLDTSAAAPLVDPLAPPLSDIGSPDNMLNLGAIFIIGLILSGFFSMLEAAVISQDRQRLQHLAEEKNASAVIMQQLLERTDKLLSTLLLCNNLTNVVCAATATAIAARLLPDSGNALLAVTFIVTFLLLVFSEITPKVIGVRHASAIALLMARPLNVLVNSLQYLTVVANACSQVLLFIFRIDTETPQKKNLDFKEWRSALRALVRAHPDKRAHAQVVDNTLRFSELTAEKLMTPRHKIEGLNLDADSGEIYAHIRKTTRTKLPLYRGKIENIGSVVGVIDTLTALKLPPGEMLPNHLLQLADRGIFSIPAAAAAPQQLQTMREKQKLLALVIEGENQRVIGMLTYGDFSAAILGDETPSPAEKKDKSGWRVLPGDTPLWQLEQQQIGVDISQGVESATIHGMLLEHLGEMPKTPLCMKIGDWKIEIIAMTADYIKKVKVQFTEDPHPAPPPPDPKQPAQPPKQPAQPQQQQQPDPPHPHPAA